MNTIRVLKYGTYAIPNTRTSVGNMIPRRLREIYRAFISAPGFEGLIDRSKNTSAQINFGMQNGLDGSFSAVPGRPFSPMGFDRCMLFHQEQSGPYLVAKGGGLRNWLTSYLEMTGLANLEHGTNYKPIDVNPSREDYDCHPLVGGLHYEGAKREVIGAMNLLSLASSLGLDASGIGGMILPLCVRKVSTFPVISNKGQIEVFKGWDFFTNPTLNLEQLSNVLEDVKANCWPTYLAALYFSSKLSKGKQVSKLIRWLVGRAYMKLKKPVIYEYICEKGQFRVGHLYDQLLTNEAAQLRNRLVEGGDITLTGLVSDNRLALDPNAGMNKVENHKINNHRC